MDDAIILNLKIKAINAYHQLLSFDQFYQQHLAPSGQMPDEIFSALKNQGFGHVPEFAANVLWQETLGISAHQIR